jgi:fibronectin-binding autotransporter adhesin
MDTTRIGNQLRVALKHSTLAAALGTWLLAGTALAAPPANDDFANAIVLTGVGTGQTGDAIIGTQTGTNNAEATLEVSEPNPGTGATDTVWFQWTCTADGNLTVSTLGSKDPAAGEWDAVLGIYSGAALNALTPLGTTPQDTFLDETMTVPVTGGTTYHIQLAGYGTAAAANILLKWTLVPTNGAEILSFGPGATVGTVVSNAATIAWTVPNGTDPATLAPTFTLSPGATCDQTSGAIPSPNFSTGPVAYTVTSAGGSPLVNVYTVTVTVAPPSTACDITSFGANLAGSYAVITTTSSTTGTVAWYVPSGTVVGSLAPAYTVSALATGAPASETSHDFTSPVHYVVTAQDPSASRDYTVTVRVANALVWNVAGGGAWDLATTSNWNLLPGNTPTTFANYDEVTFNNTAGGTIAIAPGMAPLSTTVSAASGTYTFSGGPIASGSLTKSGGGQLTLQANNTYSGGTTINNGTLYLDVLASSALGTGPVTLNGGTLYLQRIYATNDLVVNGVSKLRADNGFGDSWSGTVTLNADLTVESTTYGGPLQFNGKISGTGGLIFTGLHGVDLNVVNDYTGDTKVNSGTLSCNTIDALPGGALSISSGGAKVALNYSGSKAILALTLGGVAQTASGTYGSTTSDAIYKSGYFTGTGTVKIGDPDFAAYITSFGTNVTGSAAVIDAVVANAAAITWYVPSGTDLASLAPAFVMTSGATCTERNSGDHPVPGFNAGPVVYSVVSPNNLVTNVYTVTATVLPAESTLIWNLASGGAWNRTTPNWRGESSGFPTPYFDGVNVIFDNTAGGTIVLDGNLSPLSTTVNAASGTYSFSVAVDGGAITTGSFTKDGAGTLVMAKANSFAGGTLIKNGTLRLEWPGDGVSHTTLGSGPVTLDGGTLWLNRTDLANALTVNGGSVLLDNGFGSAWTGSITLNAPNLNITSYYSNHPFSGPISGSGGFTLSSVAGGGLALSGTNNYTGPTTVNSGTLTCNNVSALGSGALTISGSGKVNLNYSGTKTVALLTLGGVAQTTPGTYGSTASGASVQNDTYFAGSGTVTVGSDYDTWAAGYLPADVSDPAADNDGDGLTNQQEYAFGLNPTSGASANPITQQLDKTTGMFQYTRRATPATTKLTYSVLTSSNLVAWTPDVGAAESFTTSGDVQTVTFTVSPALLTAPRLFVRVAAEPAP